MKDIKQFINEKFLIDANTIIGTFEEILYDKFNKPYAICVIPEGECNNKNPIYMALLDKYEKLKWSKTFEELRLNSIFGKENTKYIYKNCNLKEYPAFEYTYNLTLGNTKLGDWFIGSKEEMKYISKHIKDIYQQLKNNNMLPLDILDTSKGYWTSSEYTKDDSFCLMNIPCFEWKIYCYSVIPLLEFEY